QSPACAAGTAAAHRPMGARPSGRPTSPSSGRSLADLIRGYEPRALITSTGTPSAPVVSCPADGNGDTPGVHETQQLACEADLLGRIDDVVVEREAGESGVDVRRENLGRLFRR